MRKVLRDWQRDWIAANGKTSDLEVVIKDSSLDDFAAYIYEGSFAGIPEELLERKVIDWGQIAASTVPERIGAYALDIEGGRV